MLRCVALRVPLRVALRSVALRFVLRCFALRVPLRVALRVGLRVALRCVAQIGSKVTPKCSPEGPELKMECFASFGFTF